MEVKLKTDKIFERHLVQKIDGCEDLFGGIVNGEFLLVSPGEYGVVSAIALEADEIINLEELKNYLFNNEEMKGLSVAQIEKKIMFPFTMLAADPDLIGKIDCEPLPGTTLFFYASHILSVMLKPKPTHTEIVMCSASFVEPKTLTLQNWCNRISQYLSHTYCIRSEDIIDSPPGTVAELYRTHGTGPSQRFELFRTDIA
jgi:hypothetical protein